MEQNEKDLLLKDLCYRLPYNVKVLYENEVFIIDSISTMYEEVKLDNTGNYTISIFDIKPYLFPLSSMTEEQSIELFNLFGISLVDSIGTDYIKINECTGITFFLDKGFDIETHLNKLLDWLNKNYLDYRGLISMGLAEDASGLNIY